MMTLTPTLEELEGGTEFSFTGSVGMTEGNTIAPFPVEGSQRYVKGSTMWMRQTEVYPVVGGRPQTKLTKKLWLPDKTIVRIES